MLISSVLSFARVFFYARLLDVPAFGTYNLSLLILSICTYLATVGLGEGLAREIPILDSQGRREEAKSVRDAAFVASLLTSSIVGGAAALVTAGLALSRSDLRAIPWVGLVIIAAVPFNLLQVDLAARRLTNAFANMLLAKNLVSLMGGMLGGWVAGVEGILVGEALGTLVAMAVSICLYARDLVRAPVTAAAWFPLAYRVAAVGIPFMLGSLVLTFTLSLDNWFVHYRFSLETFGKYSFAFIPWSAGMILNNVVSTYLTPRIINRFAGRNDLRGAFKFVWRLGWVILTVFLVAALPCFALYRALVASIYPQYSDVASLIVPVYFGIMCWMMNQYSGLFMLHGNGRYVLGLTGGNALVSALVYWVALRFSLSLADFANLFLAMRLLHLLSTIVLAWWLARTSAGDTRAPAGGWSPAA
jgi:O-antigen/teichoic acid export membrane protein